jgi:hypothetical protein
MGVEVWPIALDKCTYTYKDEAWNKNQRCPAGFPAFKLQWASYALALMWIEQHPAETGGVLVVDFHSYFQANPFTSVAKNPPPVMLFEEHINVTTSHWLVDYPVTHCRGKSIGAKPMISCGAVLGSRAGVSACRGPPCFLASSALGVHGGGCDDVHDVKQIVRSFCDEGAALYC